MEPPRARLDRLAETWRVTVERIDETPTALRAFGTRDGDPVVLKVAAAEGDEWSAGRVLSAFGGNGAVRVYEHEPGAALLERARPGGSLAELTGAGRDDAATLILADLVDRMAPVQPLPGVRDVAGWERAFDAYLASGDAQLPQATVADARLLFNQLCESQRQVRLLHGDLHHDNVVFDQARGWLAIDPKGVIGEREYEVGAFLRNPRGRPDVFADARVLERRVACFTSRLGLDRARVLAWAWAQTVLAAIWIVEDGGRVEPGDGWLELAALLRPRLAYDGRIAP